MTKDPTDARGGRGLGEGTDVAVFLRGEERNRIYRGSGLLSVRGDERVVGVDSGVLGHRGLWIVGTDFGGTEPDGKCGNRRIVCDNYRVAGSARPKDRPILLQHRLHDALRSAPTAPTHQCDGDLPHHQLPVPLPPLFHV